MQAKLLQITLRGGLLLLLFALLGTGIVAWTERNTAEQIATNERNVLLRTLNELIPANEYNNDLLATPITLPADKRLDAHAASVAYRATLDDKPVAVFLQPVTPDGYSGSIKLLVAILENGTIAGVRVLQHRETPGLGDYVETNKSSWIHSFIGRSLGNPEPKLWQVKRDGGVYDQFTGATITPRAVVRAVARSLEYFRVHRATLLGLEVAPTPQNNASPAPAKN
jgi:electron transport complex protein RnfG